MDQIRWTPQAARDLDSIARFIAKDSPLYAHFFVEDVFAALERLKRFPASGRTVPEINNSSVRELVLGNYRIVYRLKSGRVELLTIHHGARLLSRSKLI